MVAPLRQREVIENVTSILVDGTRLRESGELLDVDQAPESEADGAFSVMPAQIANTQEYRDKAGLRERAVYDLDVVCAWMMNVHTHRVTRDRALDDTEDAVRALVGDTSAKSHQFATSHGFTEFTVHEDREWLFATVKFSVQTDIQL